jgi:4,5-DOPA dioxygenase extradiol
MAMENLLLMMPVLFIGHGSPMNAIEENKFTAGWRSVVATMPRPKAILCISAHWESCGTMITSMDKPRTIHDFGGFPQKLYEVQYPAAGNPALATEIIAAHPERPVLPDMRWGLDHGSWSILNQMYPDASVPVLQMSLDYRKSAMEHYEFAKDLATLRDQGVLIIGSGNLVHNLRAVDWSGQTEGFDWAMEADHKFKKLIAGNDHPQLIDYQSLGKEVAMAVPTPEHFLPLLYVLALQRDNEQVTFFNDKLVMGSLSMTSLKIG